MNCEHGSTIPRLLHPVWQEIAPSCEEVTLATRLPTAGDCLGVKLADHVVSGGKHWHSFRALDRCVEAYGFNGVAAFPLGI
jgi:hypothetical protein